MTVVSARAIAGPERLTPEWLSLALGRQVHDVSFEQVGSGQIGTCYRLRFTDGDGPARVLAKLPTADPGMRSLLAGSYRAEVRFYTQLADTVSVRVPRCYFAVEPDDDGVFTILMEDVADAPPGDQLRGCTVAQAAGAAVNLAGLHGPRWCDPGLLDLGWITVTGPDDARSLSEMYGPATDTFVGQLAGLLSEETRRTLYECVEVVDRWLPAHPERFALVHGDYRLDNLLFPVGRPGVVAVDWQTLSIGLPARDLAYLLGTGLCVEDRRAHERALVGEYHSALVGHGVVGYDEETCWEDYRTTMAQGPLTSVFGCAYGQRSERGDRMFASMVERSCAAIRDLGTIDACRRLAPA